jgi:hypothetical protein
VRCVRGLQSRQNQFYINLTDSISHINTSSSESTRVAQNFYQQHQDVLIKVTQTGQMIDSLSPAINMAIGTSQALNTPIQEIKSAIEDLGREIRRQIYPKTLNENLENVIQKSLKRHLAELLDAMTGPEGSEERDPTRLATSESTISDRYDRQEHLPHSVPCKPGRLKNGERHANKSQQTLWKINFGWPTFGGTFGRSQSKSSAGVKWYSWANDTHEKDLRPLSDKTNSTFFALNVAFLSVGYNMTFKCLTSQRVSSFDMQLKTYNIVDYKSPIFLACVELDALKVQELFQKGLASPSDRTICGKSPAEYVLTGLTNNQRFSEEALAGGRALFRLLARCLDASGHVIRPSELRSLTQYSRNPEKIQSQIDATLVIFQLAKEDPFAGADPGLFLSLGKIEQDDVCKTILQQDYWSINLDNHSFEYCPGYFIENDRQILNDPEGLAMKAALARGELYCATDWVLWSRKWSRAPLHSLLEVSCFSPIELIEKGCVNRLTALLEHGLNPRATCRTSTLNRSHLDGLYEPEDEYGDYYKGLRPLSVTEFSHLSGTFELWTAALLQWGMSNTEIMSFVDEDQYLGVPELLNGAKYMTQIECREEFVEALSLGAFSSIREDQKTYYDGIGELERNLGINLGYVCDSIRESNSALEHRRTPGSWPETTEIKLTPWVNFFVPWCPPDTCSAQTRESWDSYACKHGRDYVRLNFAESEWESCYDSEE